MQKIRARYNQIAKLSKEGKASLIKSEEIDQDIKNIFEETQKAKINKNSANQSQLSQYMDHYWQFIDLLNDYNKKKFSKQDFDKKCSEIFKTQTSKQIKNSQPSKKQKQQDIMFDSPSSRVQRNSKNQNTQSYFASKLPRNAPSDSFKNVLNDPLLPNNQTFKKKKPNFPPSPQKPKKDDRSQQQLDNLRYENKQLKKLLERSKPNQEQKYKYQQKIQQLQNQIYQLQKSEKVKYVEKYIQPPFYPQQQQQPYVLYPRQNDLKVLTQKSQSKFDKNQKFDDLSNRDNKDGFILQPSSSRHIFKNRGSRTQYRAGQSQIIQPSKNQSNFVEENSFERLESLNNIQRGSHFDSFSLHSSNYSTSLIPGRERYGVQDPLTCTRNKVAFFKNSLRIAYDDKYEIAFKRSDINFEENDMRLIFFVKNKTSRPQSVSIQYQNQRNYNISIEQKMKVVEPFGQSRQAIIIKNKNNYELDSIVDVKFTIGSRVYNLWVPANFIKFDYHFRKLGGSTKSINVIPQKYFETYQQAVKVLPLANKQQSNMQISAYLYGISKCNEGSIKLTWNRQRQLKIQTSEKWISYISFLLCKNI